MIKSKNIVTSLMIIMAFIFMTSCNENETIEKESIENKTEVLMEENSKMGFDKRISLELNPMQKNHQLKNMRSHLEAIQNIITLLTAEEFDEASKVAYTKLGSTTEMKLMCASFGDEGFEHLGLEFHESADEMSEIFKGRDKNESLKALSNTMSYCVQCHATYRQ